ncbi:hypothetical protein [Halohasta salina]|uniref:hypothetical protein n=1 Tax=Halohasta salina TaxID=2961621 RepID=UPI0020A2AB09|nr:hypothetical protein [Halohasta salina]
MVDYYDWVLAGIVGSVLLGAVVSAVVGVGLQTGLFAGTLVATLFLYDAIVRNPPLPRTDPAMIVPVAVWHLGVVALGIGVIG